MMVDGLCDRVALQLFIVIQDTGYAAGFLALNSFLTFWTFLCTCWELAGANM